MSKLSKPLDIPLRGSKKSFVGIGQNILSDEENSVDPSWYEIEQNFAIL